MNDRYIEKDFDVEVRVGEKTYYSRITIGGYVDSSGEMPDVCFASRPERLDHIIDARDFVPDLIEEWHICNIDRAERY